MGAGAETGKARGLSALALVSLPVSRAGTEGAPCTKAWAQPQCCLRTPARGLRTRGSNPAAATCPLGEPGQAFLWGPRRGPVRNVRGASRCRAPREAGAGPARSCPLWCPDTPFRGGLCSLRGLAASCLTGNPSCPGELLVCTAPGDGEMQAVFALGLFSFHGKQNQTHTWAQAH